MNWKKFKTKMPGVRYREHTTRKHGVRYDRYFFIRYKLNGKDKEEALGWESQGWTEKKAGARLSELKESHRTGLGEATLSEKRKAANERKEQEEAKQAKIKRESTTFSTVFEQYIKQAEQDKSRSTYIVERTKYNKWLKLLLGNVSMKDISPFLLERLKKQMADAGLSPRSITYALALVRQIFNYAKNHDLYSGDNPVSKVKKPHEDNRRSRFLSHEEADLLLEELAKVSISLHDMTLLSLHCGLRAGEIFNLTWNDVDFNNETILIKDTKSKRNRNAIMTADVKAMLEARKREARSEIIFPSRNGERTTEISRAFDRAVERLGLNKGIKDRRQKVVFHTLRHTYASWLVMSGVDLYTVQKLMGHSTIAMTERYSHLAPNHLKKAIDILEKSINQSKENNILDFKNIATNKH